MKTLTVIIMAYLVQATFLAAEPLENWLLKADRVLSSWKVFPADSILVYRGLRKNDDLKIDGITHKMIVSHLRDISKKKRWNDLSESEKLLGLLLVEVDEIDLESLVKHTRCDSGQLTYFFGSIYAGHKFSNRWRELIDSK